MQQSIINYGHHAVYYIPMTYLITYFDPLQLFWVRYFQLTFCHLQTKCPNTGFNSYLPKKWTNEYLRFGQTVSYISYNNAWPMTASSECQGSHHALSDTHIGFARLMAQILPWPHITGKMRFGGVQQQSRDQTSCFLFPCPQLVPISLLHFCPRICSFIAHTQTHSLGGVLWNSGPCGLYLSNISNSLFSESQ